jgi:hypothetical protein
MFDRRSRHDSFAFYRNGKSESVVNGSSFTLRGVV